LRQRDDYNSQHDKNGQIGEQTTKGKRRRVAKIRRLGASRWRWWPWLSSADV
jgi:hypothetical protein